ncbi:DUF429 domain-containing protein [Mesorhizobium sp. CAU 1741]|uniref:DUF429 domain-containing protein n=1 Tax=Mesorhizobium sp. CAU 1741 TaxID=3140366 RepID=UPI00325B8886
MTVCAGVDGCKAGWVAAIRDTDGTLRAQVVATLETLVEQLPDDAVIAVDMPIGLPERVGKGGRGPEALVRRQLSARQSSVFSIPSRAAVHAEPGPFASIEEWYAAHRRASDVARRTSEPPRGVSIQAFGIFSKIREIDDLLVRRPGLRRRVVESHPEVAFWRANGSVAMSLPKKIKGRVNQAGMDERRALLVRSGLDAPFVTAARPRGAADDDFLDACAVLLVAEAYARGSAICFPDPPLADARGIPIAIWA